MPGIWIILIGLVCAVIGIHQKRTRSSVVLIWIGALIILMGIVLFYFVYADIVRFPLN